MRTETFQKFGSTDSRVDQLEADRKRMTRDINDLFALIKVGGTGAPTTAGSHSGSDTAKLIEDLENELAKK